VVRQKWDRRLASSAHLFYEQGKERQNEMLRACGKNSQKRKEVNFHALMHVSLQASDSNVNKNGYMPFEY
jgi:hypothetical protein